MDVTPLRLGLGTVKWGRTEGLKHQHFALPEDAVLEQLMDIAIGGGVRFLDTAPAYGVAEERIGRLLGARRGHFEVFTKAGEIFDDGESRWDFSAPAIRLSVERSLRRLQTDVVDGVLLHCPRDDLKVLMDSPALETLHLLKAEGKLRAAGVSVMSLEGGLAAVPLCDAVMIAWNTAFHEHEPVIRAAAAAGCRILLKKVLYSGFLPPANPGMSPAAACLHPALALPGEPLVITGTVSPAHLRENMAAAAGPGYSASGSLPSL